MATARGLAVLQAIVNDYVATREPVGSAGIVARHDFSVSAATIRNDMAALEEEQLIAAPHPSAGRVPTEKDYRVFVDNLTRLRGISAPQRRAIERFLRPGEDDLDQLIEKTVRLLAQLTNQLALVRYPTFSHSRIRRVDIVDLEDERLLVVLITSRGMIAQHPVALPAGQTLSTAREAIIRVRRGLGDELVGTELEGFEGHADAVLAHVAPGDRDLAERLLAGVRLCVQGSRSERLLIAGTGNLLRTEADFDHTLVPVLEAIEEQVTLIRLLGEMSHDGSAVSVRIGRENDDRVLEETAVVSGGYGPGDREVGRLGVLGPTRMDYRANIAAVHAVAGYLSKVLR
jgi:heat-inducible transcriptional repressor